jgi:hypothetical protein
MAEVGDFQDLLDAIKTAKEILDPGALELIERKAELEHKTTMDKEMLSVMQREIVNLEEKKSNLMESFNALDVSTFALSPNTGAAQKLAGQKYSSYDEVQKRLSNQVSTLTREIAALDAMDVEQQAAKKQLQYSEKEFMGSKYGFHPVLFEQADFDHAQSKYKERLESEKKANPDLTDRKIAMRMYFHNKAYMSVHGTRMQEQTQAGLKENEDKFTYLYENSWKKYASPTTVQGETAIIQFNAVETLVDEKMNAFKKDVEMNVDRMYASKTWTTDNAPIKIKNGKPVYDPDWFKQAAAKFPNKTREEVIRHFMIQGAIDFLGHANTTDAFSRAMEDNNLSSLMLTDNSQSALVPGLGYGKLLWGTGFEDMEDYYSHKEVKRLLNLKIIGRQSIKDLKKKRLRKRKII